MLLTLERCLGRLAGGAEAWVSSLPWMYDGLGTGWGKVTLGRLCQAISLELSVSHDDLARGGTWFISRETWNCLNTLKAASTAATIALADVLPLRVGLCVVGWHLSRIENENHVARYD